MGFEIATLSCHLGAIGFKLELLEGDRQTAPSERAFALPCQEDDADELTLRTFQSV